MTSNPVIWVSPEVVRSTWLAWISWLFFQHHSVPRAHKCCWSELINRDDLRQEHPQGIESSNLWLIRCSIYVHNERSYANPVSSSASCHSFSVVSLSRLNVSISRSSVLKKYFPDTSFTSSDIAR